MPWIWLSWRRSAELRKAPLFPPATPPKPNVEKGTLILHGGSGVNEETFEHFIELAGGQDAPIVCMPSAGSIDEGEEPNSFSAGRLRDMGCTNVTVLHTRDNRVADQNAAFLAPLEKAQGVWIDGGRTYRFMDSYQYTHAHHLLFEVLERDGVVGGSSAGCQVLGDFLVRGNPRTNQDTVFEGYKTGLGLIQGVILDAHFVQRERQEEFEGLMARYPQMLGIGVDANTALIIQGSTGRVMGDGPVLFYDYSNGAPDKDPGQKGIPVDPGGQYDLATRKPME